MTERIPGYCKKQKKEYVISIRYLDASDLSEKKRIKGIIERCDYAASIGECDVSPCSIWENAPDVIPG